MAGDRPWRRVPLTVTGFPSSDSTGAGGLAREDSRPPGSGLGALLRRDNRAARFLVFAAFFVLILILKFPVLDQPPVWDGAMSVFPAAITLAEEDFDLPYLLSRPGFREAGPNVHGLSPVTWLTAVIIRLVGTGPALLPVLHLVHFAIAAAAMSALFRFSRPLGDGLAVLTAVAALAFPAVLTQAGYLYLEFPMLAATVLAALAWVRQDLPKALIWSCVAVLIKGSGIIVPVALAGLAFFDPRPNRRNPRAGMLLAVVPSALLALTIAVLRDSIPGAGDTWYAGFLTLMFMYLVRVPDLLILLILYLAAMILLAPWRQSPQEPEEPGRTQLLITAFLMVSFFAFYFALPLVMGAVVVNPRYYVQIIPFALYGLVAAARRRYSDRAVAAVLMLLIVWFGVNRNGDFYPDNSINNFGLIERSGAYADLLSLQRAGVRAIEGLPSTVPVFYDQATHLRFQYPEMGYTQRPLSNGHYVLADDRWATGDLEEFPAEFYMLYEYPWMGGEVFRSILEQAEDDTSVDLEVTELTVAQFRSRLIRVERSPS